MSSCSLGLHDFLEPGLHPGPGIPRFGTLNGQTVQAVFVVAAVAAEAGHVDVTVEGASVDDVHQLSAFAAGFRGQGKQPL